MDEDAPWVAEASCTEIADPARARPDEAVARSAAARRALVWGILGVVCLGFLFGPIAVAAGHRIRMALLAEGEPGSAALASPALGGSRASCALAAHRAIALGRLGLALHLTLAMTALPWVLFMLPFFGG